MNGTIKTYLPEKNYGFIIGDDGKDYFFHDSEFKHKNHKDKICENAIVEFDQVATPKGYKARDCVLVDPKEINTYSIPPQFLISKSDFIKDWEIVDLGEWKVYGSSRHSPDAAKENTIEKAKRTGANSLINLKYYKTTGSEPGTGTGTHNYTIHKFCGQIAFVAKKDAKGKYLLEDLCGLNRRAETIDNELKNELAALSEKPRFGVMKKKSTIFFTIVLVIIGLGTLPQLTWPLLIVGAIGSAFSKNPAHSFDHWIMPIDWAKDIISN